MIQHQVEKRKIPDRWQSFGKRPPRVQVISIIIRVQVSRGLDHFREADRLYKDLLEPFIINISVTVIAMMIMM